MSAFSKIGEKEVLKDFEGVVELSNFVQDMSLNKSKPGISDCLQENIQQDVSHLLIKYQSIHDDITDFLEENQLEKTCCSIRDVDHEVREFKIKVPYYAHKALSVHTEFRSKI